MNTKYLSRKLLIVLVYCFTTIFSLNDIAHAKKLNLQFGNSINGVVFGIQRQPVSDVDVELLDEFSRFIARTRTASSGRYTFNNLRAGRYQIKVLPLNTGYEQQTQEYEIINLATRSSTGGLRTTGYDSAQVDFYLRPRRSANSNESAPGTIFVQENVPNQAVKVYKKALKALDNKENEKALTLLLEALEFFPDYFLALELTGIEYNRLKKYEEARDFLTKATTINDRSYNSWYALGQSQFVLKNYQGAVHASKKALELEPKSINALLLSAVSLKETGLYDNAESQLKKADDIGNGKVSEVHWQLAKLYGDKLKNFDKAADELELFLKIEPDNPNSEKIKKLIKVFRERAMTANK